MGYCSLTFPKFKGTNILNFYLLGLRMHGDDTIGVKGDGGCKNG
jgi:hypothetical protein